MKTIRTWLTSLAFATAGCTAIVLPALAREVSASSCSYYAVFATDGSGNLYRYNQSGSQVGSTVALQAGYFDVAIDSTNGTFYGMRSNGQIDVVNISNGNILRSVNARAGFYNSLSVLSTGMLVTANSNTIVYVDPRTGATTDYFDMNLIQDENGQTYTGWNSAGDFITQSDGSILALLSNGNVPVTTSGTIVVKITNGQGRILGTVPSSWGGARVGSDLIVATSTGEIRKVTSLPTSAGRGAISTTVLASIGSGYYGATGTEDSALSNCSTIAQSNVTPGADAFNAASPGTPAAAGAAPTTTTTTTTTAPTTTAAPTATTTVAATTVPATTTTVQLALSAVSVKAAPEVGLPKSGVETTLNAVVALSMIVLGAAISIRRKRPTHE